MSLLSNIKHILYGQDFESLISKLKDLTDSLDEERRKLREKDSLLSKKENLIQSLNTGISNLKSSEDILKQRIKQLESENSEKTEKLESLSESFLNTKNSLSSKIEDLNSLQLEKDKVIENLTAENNEISEKISALESNANILNLNIEKLEIKNLNKNEELRILQSENAKIVEDSSINEAKIQDLLSKLSNLEEVNTVNEASIEKLTVKNKNLSDNISSLKCKNKEIEADSLSKQKDIDILITENDELKRDNKVLTEKNSLSNERLKSIENENSSYKELIGNLLSENNSLEDKLYLAIKDNEQEKEKLVSLKRAYKELEDNTNASISNYNSVNDDLQNIKEKYEELEKEKESLQPYMYLIKEQKEKEEKLCILDALIKTVRDISEDIIATDIHNKLDSSVIEAEKICNSASSSSDEISQTIKTLNDVLEDCKKEQEKLIHEQQLVQKKNILTTTIGKAKEKLSSIENTGLYEQLEDVINVSAASLGSNSHDEIDEAKEELESYLLYIDDRIKELEEQARQIDYEEEQIEGLRKQARDLLNTDIYSDLYRDLKFLLSSTDNLDRDIEIYRYYSQKFREKIYEVEESKKIHVVKRSIEEVWDKKEGVFIKSDEFFARPEHELINWRRIFEESLLYGENRFLCPYCKQPVKISGRKFNRGIVSFFSHLHDSDYCEIKTTSGLTKEQIEARKYGLVSESERHIRLKGLISETLRSNVSAEKGVSDVAVEKRVDSDIPYLAWRRPDVMARYKGMNIVFELQLSTTFISVVVQRDLFYRLNDYFIIWVFNFDENEKYVDLTNLMCKDIYYANKRNIFVFDKEAQAESSKRGELVLKCNWLDPDSTWHYSVSKGNSDGILVTLEDLKYDPETCKPYYYDAETPYFEIHPEVKERLLKEEKTKQEMYNEIKAREQRDKEMQMARQQAAIREMLETGGCIEPYKEGSKWGFAYNGVSVLQPKYSSCEKFDDNGNYKVGFNRKYALLDKYGQMIYDENYLGFHRMPNGIIVAENVNGFYISENFKICDRRPHDYIGLYNICEGVAVFTHNCNKTSIFIIQDTFFYRGEEDGCYSFYDINNKKLIDKSFSGFRFFSDYSGMWLKESKTNKWHLANIEGIDLNDRYYDSIKDAFEGIVAERKYGTDIYRTNGELLISTDYDHINPIFNSNLKIVIKDDKIGITDKNLNVILPTEYSEINLLFDNIKACYKDKWALFTMDGVKLTDFIFDELKNVFCYSYIKDNYISVRQNDKYGIITTRGRSVINCVIDKINFLNDENTDTYIAICCINDRYSMFRLDEEEFIDSDYEKIESYTTGLLRVCDRGLYGLIDYCGVVKIPLLYTWIRTIENIQILSEFKKHVFICLNKDDVSAYCIEDNETVVPFGFQEIKRCTDELFSVRKNNLWALYKGGEGLLTDFLYNKVVSVSENRIEVMSKTDELGHLNFEGEETFSETYVLKDGYVLKKFFGTWALFKTNGTRLSDFKYTQIIEYDDDKITLKNKYGCNGCIDFEGNEIITSVKDVHEGMVTKERFSRWGLFDKDGNQKIPFQSSRPIKYMGHGLYKVFWGKECGLININNVCVTKTIYKDIFPVLDYPYLIALFKSNKYKLLDLNGRQEDIPRKYRSIYFSTLSYRGGNMLLVDNTLVSLEDFEEFPDKCYSCTKLGFDDLYIVNIYSRDTNRYRYGIIDSCFNKKMSTTCYRIKKIGEKLIECDSKSDMDSVQGIDLSGKELIYSYDGSFKLLGAYDYIYPQSDGTFKVQINRNSGLLDNKGSAIPDEIIKLSNGMNLHRSSLGLEIYNEENEVVIPLYQGFLQIDLLKNGMFMVQKYGLWGIIDSKCNTIVPCKFSYIKHWVDDVYILSYYESNRKNNNKFEIKDLSSDTFKDEIFNSVKIINDDELEIVINNRRMRIGKNGKEILNEVKVINNHVIVVKSAFDYRIVLDDNILLEGIKEVSKWNDNILKLKCQNNLYRLFNVDTQKFNNIEFSTISDIVDGIASASVNGIECQTDCDGEVLISDDLDLGNNYRKQRYLNEWKIINPDGTLLFDDICTEVATYKGRLTTLKRNSIRVTQYVNLNVPIKATFERMEQDAIIYMVGDLTLRLNKEFLDLEKLNIDEFVDRYKEMYLSIYYLNKSKCMECLPYDKSLMPELYKEGELYEATIITINKRSFIFKVGSISHVIKYSLIDKDKFNTSDVSKNQKIVVKYLGFNIATSVFKWNLESVK